MSSLTSFLRILDLRVLVVTGLALVSTWVASALGLYAEMPTTIISIAVIFPIVFSINAAYVRREEALRAFASLKSHGGSLVYAHRDWLRAGDDDTHAQRGRQVVRELIQAVERYLASPREGKGERLPAVYEALSRTSLSIEALRDAGMSGSEISRLNQYLKGMLLDFELMKNIAAYRTPIPLRAYSHVFLNLFPIVFGPYFAWLSRTYYPGMGYAVATLYSVVLVSLDNIQTELEDPFDGSGEDDVRLDVADWFVGSLG